MDAQEKKRIALQNLAKGHKMQAEKREQELAEKKRREEEQQQEEEQRKQAAIQIQQEIEEATNEIKIKPYVRPYRYWFEETTPKETISPKEEPIEEPVEKESPKAVSSPPSLWSEIGSSAIKVFTALALLLISASTSKLVQSPTGGKAPAYGSQKNSDVDLYLR